jgi:cyanate lyase
VIYRLYEIVGVYGETIKQIIHEKLGDGIMCAIDFSMHIEKVPDPKGDRVCVHDRDVYKAARPVPLQPDSVRHHGSGGQLAIRRQ